MAWQFQETNNTACREGDSIRSQIVINSKIIEVRDFESLISHRQ